jgi:hypothetical protein
MNYYALTEWDNMSYNFTQLLEFLTKYRVKFAAILTNIFKNCGIFWTEETFCYLDTKFLTFDICIYVYL